MRTIQPNNSDQILPYSIIKLQGCTDSTIGFDILDKQGEKGARRYCNKVLVHECITVANLLPTALVKAEFMATADPCYTTFNVFKTSEADDYIDATIDLQLDTDGPDPTLVIGILVHFIKEESCCLPLRMAYKLYGFTDPTSRILLSTGNMYVSPCSCSDAGVIDTNVTDTVWTGIAW